MVRRSPMLSLIALYSNLPSLHLSYHKVVGKIGKTKQKAVYKYNKRDADTVRESGRIVCNPIKTDNIRYNFNNFVDTCTVQWL